MKRSILLVLVVSTLVLFSVASSKGFQDKPVSPQYFIAIFSLGPSWDNEKAANQQTGFKEHSANLQRLRADKKATLGGRFADKGMVIIEAADAEAAREMFATDVMVQSKVFTLELYPFKPFFKGCIE